MAKILCITSGLTGILNSSFELAKRIESLGHQVICASPQHVESKVRAQGIGYLQLKPVQFDPAPPLPHFSGPFRKIYRLIHKIRHKEKRQRKALENLGMKAFKTQLDSIKPDLTIIDIELHEHIITLVSSEYKCLLLSQWFSTWDSFGLPPIQSSIIPGVGFWGSKLGLALRWKNIRLKRKFIFLKKKMTSFQTDRRSILKLYAKSVSFSLNHIRKNYWPGPFSYEGLPVISMTEKSIEFPHQTNTDLTYVGAMVNEDRVENFSDTEQKRLDDILTLKNVEDRKLIYCSVSTFSQGDAYFLSKVIDGVRPQGNWLLVISLGGKLNVESLGEVPEHIYVFSRVPQLKMLKVADLSINHGGIHTINECLHFGVPMLVYSGKRSDQNGCAARVHYHGLGLMADKDSDGIEDIRSKISLVLNSNSIRQNMKKFMLSSKDSNHILSDVLIEMGIRVEKQEDEVS